jgi:hypothetical protein
MQDKGKGQQKTNYSVATAVCIRNSVLRDNKNESVFHVVENETINAAWSREEGRVEECNG